MPILLNALLGARRARLVALVSLAVGLVIMLAIFGGMFSFANRIKGAFSSQPATVPHVTVAPHATIAPTTAHVPVAYHAAPGYREVSGTGFATEYPAGWRGVIKHAVHKGWHGTSYEFVSGRRLANAYSIPPAGEVALTMDTYPIAALAKEDPHQATQTPEEFLLYVVDFAKGFKHVGRVSPDSASTLDGAPAATLAVSYIVDGVPNVQIDTVARHDGEVYFMETDSTPATAKRADGVLGQVMAGWQWR